MQDIKKEVKFVAHLASDVVDWHKKNIWEDMIYDRNKYQIK